MPREKEKKKRRKKTWMEAAASALESLRAACLSNLHVDIIDGGKMRVLTWASPYRI